MPQNTLTANVAGLFYPADTNELRSLVATLLTQNPKTTPKPTAIIAPHAGYIYSGLIAAQVYAGLTAYQNDFDHVIIFAPAHRYYVEGVVAFLGDNCQTPLGTIPINQTCVKTLIDEALVQPVNDAFIDEHAIEVQLPFLQTVLKTFSVTPLLVGNTSYETITHILNQIDTTKTLIVISSDLSHFLSYANAKKIDQRTAGAILALNPDNISNEQACGQISINGLLTYAKEKQWKPHLVGLNNSGDTAGDKEKVVGYGGFYFTQQ